MTPTEFSSTLTALGWQQNHLAERLGCNPGLCAAWASGRATVPPPIAVWLLKFVTYQAANPPPPWRKHPGFGRSDEPAPRSEP